MGFDYWTLCHNGRPAGTRVLLQIGEASREGVPGQGGALPSPFGATFLRSLGWYADQLSRSRRPKHLLSVRQPRFSGLCAGAQQRLF